VQQDRKLLAGAAGEFAAFNVRPAEVLKELPTVPISEVSRFKIAPGARSADTSLREDQD
jgi:hypothetical protein